MTEFSTGHRPRTGRLHPAPADRAVRQARRQPLGWSSLRSNRISTPIATPSPALRAATADGRSIYLLATTNGDPALTADTPITSWVVGLYEDQSDSVALVVGEAGVEALGGSPDALGCALTRAWRCTSTPTVRRTGRSH
ncbi:hypothetical protein R1X32_09910 (plasmid) [Rhodococcus opacus]|uniref:hypothetical protein n=1 Tax=Rhodococcus opacus TaxID=37919 RepID=UPI0034D37AB4